VQVISNPDKNNDWKQIRIEKRRAGENRFYIHADVRLAAGEARQVRRPSWLPRSQAAPGRGGGGALQSECLAAGWACTVVGGQAMARRRRSGPGHSGDRWERHGGFRLCGES
jgi:hypothetical protein